MAQADMQARDVIDQLVQQHKQILSLAEELNPLLDNVADTHVAVKAREILDKFSALLDSHLKVEDSLLYPALMHSSNDKVRQTASTFSEQMGHLLVDVRRYMEKWTTSIYIAAEAIDFTKETIALLAVLMNRIEKENNELFPLLT